MVPSLECFKGAALGVGGANSEKEKAHGERERERVCVDCGVWTVEGYDEDGAESS